MEESYFCSKALAASVDMDATSVVHGTNGERNGDDDDDGTCGGGDGGGVNETTLNDQTLGTDLEMLKKNLANEEEFRSINHTEPIHIFLKIKPLSGDEQVRQNGETHFRINSDTSVSVRPPKSSVYAQNKQNMLALSNTLYQFSYVFQPDIRQADFFKATIYPCVERLFAGDNLLIFSYGVTFSGKTYTMQGTNADPGLIPRTLDLLFDSLGAQLETQRAQYSYKPDKFNEMTSLTEAELTHELAHKEHIMRLSNIRELERSDSFDSLNTRHVRIYAHH